jgi:hypothetical protein
MTFIERFLNTLSFVALQLLPVQPAKNVSLLKIYAPGIQSWDELLRKSLLFVIERDHSLDWPTPSMPHVIHVPGASLTQHPTHHGFLKERGYIHFILIHIFWTQSSIY